MKRALIVLPTYNERENIKKLIPHIQTVIKSISNWQIDILIVDDTSPDKTAEAVKELQKQYKNLHLIIGSKEGLGKAYTRGFEYGIEKLNPYVMFQMDADLSHDPKEIPVFLKKIEEGADFVIGSRYIRGGSIPSNWGIDRKIFSFVGNLIIRVGFMKLRIAEWTSGYRAIKASIIKESISHITNYTGYVFQMALLDFAIKHHAKIVEIPIHFTDRVEGVSKINKGQYIRNIFTYIFINSPFIKFGIVGGIGFIIDSTILYINLDKFHLSNALSKLISAETAIFSNFLLNNFWTFSHKKINNNFTSYFRQFVKFNLVSGGSILIQLVLFTSLLHFYPQESTIAKLIFNALIIGVVIIPYSYILYNRVIWKKK